MIDTIKIYSSISTDIAKKIESFSLVKSCYDNFNNIYNYKIINDSLKGSFDNNLSVRVCEGSLFRLDSSFCIIIEGSLHKLTRAQNAFDGYYDFNYVCHTMIDIVSKYYDIDFSNNIWFVQRVDVALCFDLNSNDNVCKYINAMSLSSYNRRKSKFFTDECLYFTGTTTTLKIYNKLLEFKKHDAKNYMRFFNVLEFEDKIKGFIRFECEIKIKKLKSFYNKDKIMIGDINYTDLFKIWSDEFNMIYKFVDNNIKKIETREEVHQILFDTFKNSKATRLYNFYCSILLNGYNDTKLYTPRNIFYRNISELKKLNIDFTKKIDIVDNSSDYIYFNPFEFIDKGKEVI